MRETAPSFTALTREAFQVGVTVDAWARRVTATFATLFPRSVGTVTRVLDLRTRKPRGGYLLHDCQPEIEQGLLIDQGRSQNRVDLVEQGAGLRRLYGSLPAQLREERYVRELRYRLDTARLDDMHHLTVTDGATLCVTLGTFLPSGEAAPGTPAAWAAMHARLEIALAVQVRAEQLKERLQAGPGEVVMTPDGEVAEADGGALTQAMRAKLRAMARDCRPLADSAEAAWRGVLDGQYSILDRHDHQGRRYIVAVPLRPGLRDSRSLSAREADVAALAAEGHGDKEIAWLLGVNRSTVATQLHLAMNKLGLRRRTDLIRAFRRSSPKAVR